MPVWVRITLSFLLGSTTLSAADPVKHKGNVANTNLMAKPAEGALENHLDLSYLTPDRDIAYVEPDHPSYSARVNVHRPPGNGPFPCLLVIHGGGYFGGDKDSAEFHSLCEAAIKRGYVTVNVGYIKGLNIHPQVQRDFKELVRWLRANAERFSIDSERIGAWGFSAGGWLASSSAMSTVDDVGTRSIRSVRLTEYLRNPGTNNGRLYVPFDAAAPNHASLSSRINVIIADFHHSEGRLTPDDPIVATYVGLGVEKGISHESFQQAGVPLVEIELSEEQTRGKGNWHVPDLTQTVNSRAGNKKVSLRDRMFEFLEVHLKGSQTRTSPPEARPNRRIFSKKTSVSLIAASPRATIHYTTDDSKPTADSPVYVKPFSISETTTIRAFAIVPGMQPSGAITCDFIRGEVPPKISSPAKLPIARVGKPYSIQFKADADSAIWDIAFQTRSVFGRKDLSPEKREQLTEEIRAKGSGSAQVGLTFDRKKGALTGTPTREGVHVVQIRAARGPRSAASDRTYILHIK